MTKYNRIFTIVIDSLGTGAMPDSEKFGDVGVDTLGHIAEHMKEFHIPNLQKLGIANLRPLKGVAQVEAPTGRFTKFSEAINSMPFSWRWCSFSIISKISVSLFIVLI